MIRRIDLRGRAGADTEYRRLVPRAALDADAALEAVRPVCDDVRDRGTAALRDYTRKFDGVDLDRIRVPADALSRAVDTLDPEVRAALEESARRLRRSCEQERGTDAVTEVTPGGTVTRRLVPVQRVGLYVPGGLAPLVSSVVMNVVPAQVAGVPSVALASPPQRDNAAPFTGLPNPTVLGACALLGVDEVYAVGGAQAIAMFAYGCDGDGDGDGENPGDDTGTGDGGCRPVDLVTGPGNIYVVAAKRLLKGRIGIDSEAGPTEIAILADDSADPVHVAADLVSQAEHDPMAASVLVTPSDALAGAVEAELDKQVPAARHAERIGTALAGRQSGIVLVEDLEQGQAVVDAYAAEHLEIQTVDARERAMRIRNAGAVFVGPFAPVSLGDYCAGSNHVLPTGGCACHSSGLSVRSFLKSMHVVEYDAQALAEVSPQVRALALAEDLPAHAEAVRVRGRVRTER
ncbi:MAG TPA: histidinol dehydrogenase [Nocardioidaceae bacterium]|nr:histidinol dehydrogenase [Nocardioidaceae bacterium]